MTQPYRAARIRATSEEVETTDGWKKEERERRRGREEERKKEPAKRGADVPRRLHPLPIHGEVRRGEHCVASVATSHSGRYDSLK